MKAYKSPLILNNFLLLNHQYHFIQPQNAEINFSEISNEYYLDIDFAFQKIDSKIFQLFTKININNIEKPLPGYILSIEGVCVFSFNTSTKLTKEDKANLLHYSGLNISINSLRNILATTTANGPFGRYSLPSINISKLLTNKQAQASTKKR